MSKRTIGLCAAVFLVAALFTSANAAETSAEKSTRTRVVLLGTGTPSADPERSGPATAVVVDETPYIVDFGAGVVRRAAGAVAKGVTGLRPGNLQVAFVTHLHADHTMGYADLIITPWIAGRNTPLQVYGPRGLAQMTEHVLAAYRVDLDNRMAERGQKYQLVEAHEIQPGVVYRDANVTVTAFNVPHGDLVAYGYRFQTPDRVIVISGDTSPTDNIVAACNGCDILVHEHYSAASFARVEPRWQRYRLRHHTSTRQLAELATKARPGLLILYHRSNPGAGGASAPESEVIREMNELYKGRWVSGRDLDVY
jgi:ribonuclease BN (tRNA processing enzyme)